MVKVSVVIPVYNTEKYLRECLDSVVNQTLEDIEIICINDGSTDSSLEILKEYAKSDNRIIIISQENKGQSVARNEGIAESNGEYIYFMDSDDFLELYALEEAYSLSRKNDLEILIFKLINFNDGSNNQFTTEYYEMDFLKSFNKKIFNYMDLGESSLNLAVSPPGKLFKKELISQIRFIEGLIFEDNLFFAEAMLKAERVSFYDKHLYNRRIRKDSTTSLNDIKFADSICIVDKLIKLAKDYDIYDEFKYGLAKKKIDSAYYRYSQVDNEFKEQFFSIARKDFKNFQKEYEDKILDKIAPVYTHIFSNFCLSNSHEEYDLNNEIYKMSKKINSLKKNNNILEHKIDKLNVENEKILSSNSWKVSAPFRKFKNIFK